MKEYFESKLTVDQLILDVKDSQQRTGKDTTTAYVDNVKEGEFEIKEEHLIKLLDDTIAYKIQPNDLKTIGFKLMTSEYFYWDNKTELGERIGSIIFEFDNPEIGYELTIENFKKWKEYLITGKYTFDRYELKN
ncbi:MAG TPA: hypothetical protein VGA80_01615 [Flavobacteriaceae bacterium]